MKTYQSQQIQEHKTMGCQLHEIHILITENSTVTEVCPHPYLTLASNFFCELNCPSFRPFQWQQSEIWGWKTERGNLLFSYWLRLHRVDKENCTKSWTLWNMIWESSQLQTCSGPSLSLKMCACEKDWNHFCVFVFPLSLLQWGR